MQLALTVVIFLLLVDKWLCVLGHCFSVIFGWTWTVLCYGLFSKVWFVIGSFQKFVFFSACLCDFYVIEINYLILKCMGNSLFLAADPFVHHQFTIQFCIAFVWASNSSRWLFQDDNIRNQRENVVLTLANAQSRLGLLVGTEPVSSSALLQTTCHIVYDFDKNFVSLM